MGSCENKSAMFISVQGKAIKLYSTKRNIDVSKVIDKTAGDTKYRMATK